jgi:ATP synthase H subunit
LSFSHDLPKANIAMNSGPEKMPGPLSPDAEQAAVLEKVKRAETEAKSILEGASSRAEKTKADATAEAEKILKEAEYTASKLVSEIVKAGRTETERELERIRREATEGAEKIRRKKDKKVPLKGILESVLTA